MSEKEEEEMKRVKEAEGKGEEEEEGLRGSAKRSYTPVIVSRCRLQGVIMVVVVV